MEMPFGLYPRLYVKRKEQLFPIIEKYTGEKIDAKTSHGQILPTYLRLLRTNDAFRSEVDALIQPQAGRLLNHKEKNTLKSKPSVNKGVSAGNRAVNNAAGAVIGGIAGAVGNIFGFAAENKAAQAESDAAFMEVVLNEQKKDDTMKILVITGITLAFVGLGVYFVLKTKK